MTFAAPVLGVASLAGSLFSGIVGAQGAAQSAQATAASQLYQAQVARNNQTIAEQNARYAVEAGAAKEETTGFQVGAIAGQQEAAQGASGIDLTTGSPARVRAGTRQMGRLSELNVAQNANLQAYGYNTQATSFGAQAGLDVATAQQAKTAGGIGVASSLIGGASSFADKWSSYQLKGLFG